MSYWDTRRIDDGDAYVRGPFDVASPDRSQAYRGFEVCYRSEPPDAFEVDGVRYVREQACKAEVRESAWGGVTRHCGNCGADLDCDTRNRQNFCPKCGKKVSE